MLRKLPRGAPKARRFTTERAEGAAVLRDGARRRRGQKVARGKCERSEHAAPGCGQKDDQPGTGDRHMASVLRGAPKARRFATERRRRDVFRRGAEDATFCDGAPKAQQSARGAPKAQQSARGAPKARPEGSQ